MSLRDVVTVSTDRETGVVKRGVLGLMLGGMAGAFWAFGREMMATSRKTDPDDYAEFARLKEEAKEEVRGLWRQFRERVGRS